LGRLFFGSEVLAAADISPRIARPSFQMEIVYHG